MRNIETLSVTLACAACLFDMLIGNIFENILENILEKILDNICISENIFNFFLKILNLAFTRLKQIFTTLSCCQ